MTIIKVNSFYAADQKVINNDEARGKKSSTPAALSEIFVSQVQRHRQTTTTNPLANAKIENMGDGEEITKDRIDLEIERLENMLTDPKCDHSRILEQSFLILMTLYHKSQELEREFAESKEPELFKLVDQLKGTYNTWLSLGLVAASGAAQVGGNLLRATPIIISNASANLKEAGKLISGIGQISSGFGQSVTNRDEAKRLVIQHLIDEAKRNRSQFDDKCRQSKDTIYSIQNSWRNVADQAVKCARTMIGAN